MYYVTAGRASSTSLTDWSLWVHFSHACCTLTALPLWTRIRVQFLSDIFGQSYLHGQNIFLAGTDIKIKKLFSCRLIQWQLESLIIQRCHVQIKFGTLKPIVTSWYSRLWKYTEHSRFYKETAILLFGNYFVLFSISVFWCAWGIDGRTMQVGNSCAKFVRLGDVYQHRFWWPIEQNSAK